MKIPIVNEQDEIIGYKDAKERNPKDITRVAGLWVTNEKGEILLAQRAFSKKRDPGVWGPAVAGSVEEGETYESNIIKEAGEEIGLFNFVPIPEFKIRRSTSHEYFSQWFSAVIDSKYPLVKQDVEVEQLKWFSKEDLLLFYKQKPEMFIPSFESAIKSFVEKNET